jgi:cytochrome c-type biogenesis protein CcmF
MVMIAEWGLLAAILALVLGVWGLVMASGRWAWARHSATAALEVHALASLAALATLIACFLRSDFSVAAVAQLSNSALPWTWRVDAMLNAPGACALLVACAWGALAAGLARHTPAVADALHRRHARAVQASAAVAVLALAAGLFGANPFARSLPAPLDGLGLAITQQSALAATLQQLPLGWAIVPAAASTGVALALAFLAWCWVLRRWLRAATVAPVPARPADATPAVARTGQEAAPC